MALGYQLNGTCHATLGNFARAACSQADGLVSGGFQSCTGHSTSASSVTLYLQTTGASGATQYTATLLPMPCEYPTFNDTYLPLIGAALPVLALIFVGKQLYSIFKTEPDEK